MIKYHDHYGLYELVISGCSNPHFYKCRIDAEFTLRRYLRMVATRRMWERIANSE